MGMIAIFESLSGTLKEVVCSVEGVDLTGMDTLAAPDDYPECYDWDAVSRDFIQAEDTPEKTAALLAIDRRAEAAYTRVATAGVLGRLVHPEKLAQANAVLGDSSPDPAAYPLVANEIGVTGATIADVATAIVSEAQASTDSVLALAISQESERVAAKAAVRAATSRAAIRSVLAGLSF